MLFSNILKRKREEKGLTQAEVADRKSTRLNSSHSH